MNKKEEQKIKAIFNKIEEVKKGELLFKSNDSEYFKYNNKFYSISRHHDDDGDVWCEETTKKELKEYLEEVKENLQDDIERVVYSVRLNTLAISELYEEKIKLLELKI